MLDTVSLEKLIPRGLVASRWAVDGDELVVDAVGAGNDAACPECGVVTGQVHSRYRRTSQDLPAYGRRMVIHVKARRFRCREAACPR
jgi:transposase